MAISTATRRTARAKDIDTELEDLVIDLEDACKNLPLAEQEKLVKTVRSALAGVTSDPAGIASGRVPLALGAGTPAPAGPPTPITTTDAINALSSAMGVPATAIARLLGVIETGPDKSALLATATLAAEGHMVPQADLASAENRANRAESRIADIESEIGATVGSLSGGNWRTALNSARPAGAPQAPPAPAGTPSAAETALSTALAGLRRGGRLGAATSDRVAGSLPEATITAWRTERGIPAP